MDLGTRQLFRHWRPYWGSLTSALASSVSTWITQRHQDRRDLLAKRIFHREQLYSEFISESGRAMAELHTTFPGGRAVTSKIAFRS